MMISTKDLLAKKCQHAETALSATELAAYLSAVSGWQVVDNRIVKEFSFNNYYETIAFMNAIAYIIHAEDHHPEATLTYQRCVLKFDTHSVNNGRGGLSENDFICAAKIDALYRRSFS